MISRVFPTYYSLMETQNLTFGYIKCTPYVAFTSSFLDIVFGQYVRREMGKKLPPKMRENLIVASFHSAISPIVAYSFREKLEAGV